MMSYGNKAIAVLLVILLNLPVYSIQANSWENQNKDKRTYNSIVLPEKKVSVDDTLALVGSHSILAEDFFQRYSDYLFLTGINDNIVIRKTILNNMVNEILLEYYEDNKSILNDPEYKREAEWNRKQAVLAFLKDREIYAKISVAEDELREAFLKVNEKIAARHLYASNEEDANRLYQLLQNGVPFESLAQKVFTDSTLQNNGGYLGYFTWGDMDPAFEDAAYSLNAGEISTPVKTANGYSIIKVEDKVKVPLLTEAEFQKKKKHLERVLKIKKKTQFERAYINSIFDPAKVIFNEKSLENIKNNLLSAAGSYEDYSKKKYESECVKYENKKYNQAEIENRIEQLPAYHKERINSFETLKRVIEGYIIQDLLNETAAVKKYDKDSNVLNTVEKMNKILLLQYKKRDIVNKAMIPDSLAYEYYKEFIDLYSTPNEMNVQEIIVAEKGLADSLIKQIQSGDDFDELALKHSKREWSAKNKGIMGFAPVSMYGSMKEKLWNINVGDITGPIKINDYYGIFRVLGKKEGHPKEFSLIRNEVLRSAKEDMKLQLETEYINRLRERVTIKINEEKLGRLSAIELVDE